MITVTITKMIMIMITMITIITRNSTGQYIVQDIQLIITFYTISQI